MYKPLKIIDNLDINIKNYMDRAKDEDYCMYYITWDRRDIPNIDIGWTILSKNEYCGYRGEIVEWVMLKNLESNNHAKWLIVAQNNVDNYYKYIGPNDYTEVIEIIQKLWDKQDEMGFILCIKIIVNTVSTIESHIYNVEKLDSSDDYIQKYFINAHTWYLFIIPQKINI